MEQDNKKMIWMFAALCVAVVGLMIYLILTQFGGSPKPTQEESVVATLPDGEVRQMAGSKRMPISICWTPRFRPMKTCRWYQIR